MNFRVGFGFDTHALIPGSGLRLGGVTIPFDKTFKAHSDGDVLIHAIIDGLLGAAGLPDIGNQFPDTDPAYKGIDSAILLKETIERITARGFSVGNIDTTIVLQNPKIATRIPAIVDTLSKTMNLAPDCISVKAKTSEKLGFIGREEGVSAYTVVLLTR